MIGSLPLISLEKTSISVNVPWVLPQELDRYARSLDGYVREIESFQKKWCDGNLASKECINAKTMLGSSAFMNSITQNLKAIEDIKRLPIKLQKYVTWKQRYMSELLCNVNSIYQMTGGWLKENGLRFRKWAELVVLLRAIAE